MRAAFQRRAQTTTPTDRLSFAHRWLRQSPKVLSLPFKASVKRAERSNAIDLFVTGDVGKDVPVETWQANFEKPVDLLTEDEKREWIAEMNEVVLSSDAFFPFRDNIDHAKQYGVKYIASPGGSAKDDEVIGACNEHDIVLIHTGVRLFHH
uniref:Phosphoribosylaminoimidazolecarboxamide formyltransferase n=1 Tax=Plectus sambesii TaxID=2011161 RepID=A0A914VWC0_9BILA